MKFSAVNLRVIPSHQDTFVGLERGSNIRNYTKRTRSPSEQSATLENDSFISMHTLKYCLGYGFGKYLRGVAVTDNMEKF